MNSIRSRAARLSLVVTTLALAACAPGDPGVGRRATDAVSPGAGRPEAAPPSPPDPIELLELADEALRAARWLEFDFEYVATHAGRGRLRGHARVEPVDRDLTRSRYLIDMRSEMPVAWLGDLPRRVIAAQDDSGAWRVDPISRRLETASPIDGIGWSPTINLANLVLPPQLFRERPMGVEIDDPLRHRYAGSARVGDVECEVVYLDFPPESALGEQYFYLGKADHLPRRIILTNVHDTEMGPPMSFDLTLTDLGAGSGPPPFTFTPEIGAGFEVVDRDRESFSPGDPAPEWRLVDLEGREVSSRDLEGSVVVLEFWATWCPTCRVTLPKLETLQQEFEDLPVRFFAVQTWDRADPRAYLDEQGLELEVLLSGDELADRLKVYGTSQNVVLDPRGRIVLHDLLFPLDRREASLRRAIRSALEAID